MRSRVKKTLTIAVSIALFSSIFVIAVSQNCGKNTYFRMASQNPNGSRTSSNGILPNPSVSSPGFNHMPHQAPSPPAPISTPSMSTPYLSNPTSLSGKASFSPTGPVLASSGPADIIPPEAVISWNSSNKNIEVYGVDNIDDDVQVTSTIISQQYNKIIIKYTLTDDGGNTLEITLEHKDRDENRDITVLELIYNNSSPLTPQNNFYKVNFKTGNDSGEIKQVHQNVQVIQKFKINSHYRKNNDTTRINIREEGKEEIIRILDGLKIVNIITDKGALKSQFLSNMTITVPSDYSSIQDAINNALSGDTIYISSGVYYENIIVDQNNFVNSPASLTIEGENKNTVIIDCGGGTGINIDGDYSVDVSNVTIQNGSRGIQTNAENSLLGTYGKIHDISFNNLYYGIYLDNSNKNIIEDNVFSQVQIDIYAYSSSKNQIDNNNLSSLHGVVLDHQSNQNIINNNSAHDNAGCGIFLNHSSFNLIMNNNVYNNSIGIHINASHSNDIMHNTIYRNVFGIFMNSSSMNDIINNTLYININGIHMESSNNNKIKNGNWIHSTTQEAIYMIYSNFNEISSNLLGAGTYRNWVGIHLWDCDWNTISSNNISYNFGAINLVYSNYTTINFNNISNNFGGIHLTYSFINSITFNKVVDYGITLANSQNNNVNHNNVSNSNYGTISISSMNNNIMYNVFYNCNLAGVYLSSTNYTNIKFNILKGTTHTNGIYLSNSCLNNITTNYLNNSKFSGIHLMYNSDNNLIQFNIIYSNYNGIYTSISDSNTIEGNTFRYSTYSAVFLNHSQNNNIKLNTMDWNAVGVYLNASDYNTVDTNNHITNTSFGVYAFKADNNDILYNTIKNNIVVGIFLQNSNHTDIKTNTFDSTTFSGISLNRSGFSNISNNVINNSVYYGVHLEGNTGSLHRQTYTEFNDVNNNTITNCTFGIYMLNSDRNKIGYNTLSSHTLAMMIDISYFDDIYNNLVTLNSFGFHLRSVSHNNVTYNNINNNTNINLILNWTTFVNVKYNIIDTGLIGVDIEGGAGWNNVSYNRISSHSGIGVKIHGNPISGWNWFISNNIYFVGNAQEFGEYGPLISWSPPNPPQNNVIASPHTNFYYLNY